MRTRGAVRSGVLLVDEQRQGVIGFRYRALHRDASRYTSDPSTAQTRATVQLQARLQAEQLTNARISPTNAGASSVISCSGGELKMTSRDGESLRILMICPQFRPLVGGYER